MEGTISTVLYEFWDKIFYHILCDVLMQYMLLELMTGIMLFHLKKIFQYLLGNYSEIFKQLTKLCHVLLYQ